MRRLVLALLLFAVPAWGATPTSLDVSWDASAPFVTIFLERCQGAGCTPTALTSFQATTISYSESGLTPGAVYRYRLRGQTAAGVLAAYGAISEGTAPASGAWTLSIAVPVVDSYAVECGIGVAPSTFTLMGSAAGTTLTVTGLTPSTTYGCRVQALASNTGVPSPYSATAAGTTLAAAPVVNVANVLVMLGPEPAFAAAPNPVAFTWRAGQTLPTPIVVTVSGGSGTWTTQDTSLWFDVQGGTWDGTRSNFPATATSFTVAPSSGMLALAPGTYTETVTVRRGALTALVTVRVTVAP